jgi:glycosyltransferase involved in cell wall biosynthesis
MRPLSKAGFHGRALALVLSPFTLEDCRQAGQLGRFRRILERYARAFDSVYVLTADKTDLTAELGVSKAWHLGMPRWVPASRYLSLLLLPILHRRTLARVTVVRTLNTSAGITGSMIRRLSGASVLVSYGSSWADFASEGSRASGRIATLIENRSLRSADELIVATPAQRDYLSDLHPGKPVHLLPNFVDTGMFCPVRTTDPSAPPLLLYVGRLERQKNLPLLFDALEAAAPRIPGLRLAIVGEGPLRLQLESDAHNRELPVEFTGDVPNESLPLLFSRAFAFVLPSDSESQSTSLLEAMSSGTPCVATNVPGPRDLITDRLSGLLVPAGDPAAFANAILRLHREPSLRSRFGIEARRFVVSRYSFDASLDREVDVLLGRSGASPSARPIAARNEEVAA